MTESVLLFDGVCNLCTGAVQFIIRHDPQARIKFASLQSDAGQALLARHGVAQRLDGTDDTVIYIEDGRVYTHSDASLRVARRLGGALGLAYGFIIVPRFIRDFVYRLVARNRYRWFGRKQVCWLPTPALQARFLS
jgi:predicted DCC family thiol-disulfide oxidoreductase YuxK